VAVSVHSAIATANTAGEKPPTVWLHEIIIDPCCEAHCEAIPVVTKIITGVYLYNEGYPEVKRQIAGIV